MKKTLTPEILKTFVDGYFGGLHIDNMYTTRKVYHVSSEVSAQYADFIYLGLIKEPRKHALDDERLVWELTELGKSFLALEEL